LGKMQSWAERIAKAAATEAVSKVKGQSKGLGASKGGVGASKGGARSKGSGKNSGKSGKSGGGGGKGQDSVRKAWWQCNVPQCVAYHGGTQFWNHGDRDACRECLRPKGTAEAVVQADLLKLREEAAAVPSQKKPIAELTERIRLECLSEMAQGIETGLSKRAQRKLKKEATVEELKTAGLQVPQHRLGEACNQQGGAAGARTADQVIDRKKSAAKVTDKDELDLAMEDLEEDEQVTILDASTPLGRYGIPAERLAALGLPWKKLEEVKDTYPLPRDTPLLTAEQTVAKALEGEVSETIAARQKANAKLLGACEGLRLSLGEKDELYLQSCKRLKADTEDLQRVVKKATPKNASVQEIAKATCLRLKLAKQNAETAHAERRKRQAKGKGSGKERHEKDVGAIDKLVEELREHRQRLCVEFEESEIAWTEMSRQLDCREEEVINLLDKKIAAAGPVGGSILIAPGAVADGVAAAAATELPGDDNDLDEDADYADLTLSAGSTQPEDVPTIVIKDATADEKEALEVAWAFLEAVRMTPMGTPTPPTTYTQMGLGHVAIAQTLVGKEIWKKVYGPEREVGPDDWVPWELMELIRVALEKAKTELVSGPERKAAATERLNAARTAARNDGFCPW
jgi:hypothetical protein